MTLARIKPWVLPAAMVAGALAHGAIDTLAPLAPWLIFAMLLITFCKIKPSEIRISPAIWQLLAVQVVGAVVLFLALRPFSVILAQGAMICVFCPTATAAPVITGMLGGSISRLVTYSLISNAAVALSAPLMFSWCAGSFSTAGIGEEMAAIASRVVPMILAPLILALLLMRLAPRVHKSLATRQGISFWIWAVSLIIVVGRAVSFMLAEPKGYIPLMVGLALIAAAVCVGQFAVGRRIGRRWGDRVAGAQGLGQKNTVLAIWMALTWLDPIASVAPAAYILWQNIINSWQLWHMRRTE